MRPGQIVGPAILVGLGVLFLLNNFGFDIPIGELIRRFWPLIFVVVGVVQIAGSLTGRGSLPAGILTLVFGILFLLQQGWNIRFSDTWPVLLIAAGAIGLLRAFVGPALFARDLTRGRMRQ
jgi:hypothetical protein